MHGLLGGLLRDRDLELTAYAISGRNHRKLRQVVPAPIHVTKKHRSHVFTCNLRIHALRAGTQSRYVTEEKACDVQDVYAEIFDDESK